MGRNDTSVIEATFVVQAIIAPAFQQAGFLTLPILPQCGHLIFLPHNSALTLRFFPQEAHGKNTSRGDSFVAGFLSLERSGEGSFAARNLSFRRTPINTTITRNANMS